MMWQELARAALGCEPVALVTVLATEGSAPRGPGARMAITAGEMAGTIGGGRLEHQLVAQARAILAHPAGSWRVQDYPLGPLLGQCCGGRVRVMVERLADAAWFDAPTLTTLREGGVERRALGDRSAMAIPARGPLPAPGFAFAEPQDCKRLPLMLFGAGHVGRAIARRMGGLPLSLGWYDCRPDYDAPGVVIAPEDELVECAASARGDHAVLILTHDHGLDYRLVAAALRSRARFVGLIGSATKRARFLARLRAEGVDASRLTCPIGIPGITGKEPDTIAIAVLAQLLSLPQSAAMEQAA
ncbi:xanthine dehydrogenase accessory protein XdhC [Novosphingobium sp. KACC 22771]|uniref:xanthine dehydrogenase accessory protein XdhC n=1 Tax=Novosphingobium sp. KACC 22771 TaxID=3025670 RepID=UPI002366B3E8|nr:xanthine dehydrogenase accessory protein XdhC [Novosphingobium sp. KACC 22771]WDF73124.1 xanthine dehydrogenase accessory protein XdhC [Novosphingobium sp. KACC 22771]